MEERLMKMVSLRTVVMGLLITVATLSLTGCGIPVSLSQSVDLVKAIEVPALPETVELVYDEIPQEVRDMYPDVNWDDPEAALAELADTDLEYQREEEFCDLPDLQKIRDEAAARLPEFLAKRIEVREVIVKSIRFVANTGDFNTIVSLEDTLTVEGQRYVFTISSSEESGMVITLTPDPALDLADVINNPDFNGCIQNSLKITGTLPDTEILFKAVLDLDITLYLRIL